MDVHQEENVSFDGPQSTPISSSMDKGYYRQVPNRFFTNESNPDACKLEKLTNLFPEMKATIELELFKSNNLSRTIDRLSRVYTAMTILDVRDDTVHLFLGPYHLSLGPALFAALRFKTASASLLGASRSAAAAGDPGNHRRKRRRDAVLRRFRRLVRKLTLVKIIIDQLRPASVLTPYNQYELHTRGIYDLVLSGRPKCPDSMFTNDDFLQQLQTVDVISNTEERNPLLASNYIRINALLSLLTPPQQSQPTDTNVMTPAIPTSTATSTAGTKIRIKTTESFSNTTPNNNAENLIDSTAICCVHHRQTLPFIMFPVNQPLSPQPSQALSIGSRSRTSSNSNLLKTPSVLSRQSTVNSLPDSTTGDGSSSDLPSSTSLLTSQQSNPAGTELETPKNIVDPHPFFSTDSSSSSAVLNTNEEDALINRISSLLASHLLSRQSTATTSITSSTAHEQHETNSNLSDSAISLSTSGTAGPISSTVISNHSSPSIVPDDFDKLLQRIKTAVDNRLSIETTSNNRMRPPKSIHPNLPYDPARTTTIKRRQQLLALHAVSCQERHTDEYDSEHSPFADSKHRLDLLAKSQSFDVTNLISPSSTFTSKHTPSRSSSID